MNRLSLKLQVNLPFAFTEVSQFKRKTQLCKDKGRQSHQSSHSASIDHRKLFAHNQRYDG